MLSYRPLGASGVRVAQIFLGAMTFGEQGGVGAPLEECRRIVDAYAEVGGNAIDTAINYRDGASEEIVGALLEGRRERFVISTKFGVSRDANDPNAAGAHRKNLRGSLETSLRRLRTDYIDLYWVHMHDRHTPIDETLRALDDAVSAGKVLAIGISDTPAWIVSRAQTLAELRGWESFVGLQVPYSLLQRDIERELLPLAQGYGMSVAAWSPLGGGVLTGKYSSSSSSAPGGSDDVMVPRRLSADSLSERDHRVAAAVVEVAGEVGVSPSAVAIAWVMQRSPLIHPILGARSSTQLIDNLAAAEVALTEEQLVRVEEFTANELGFPHDFIRDTGSWVFGAANDRTLDGPRPKR